MSGLCQQRPKCEDGQTEKVQSPYNRSASQVWVVTRYVCYMFVSAVTLQQFDSDEQRPYERARQYCDFLGGKLASPKRFNELEQLEDMITDSYVDRFPLTIIGLYFGDLTLPNMYRFTVTAEDKTILHNTMDMFLPSSFHYKKSCLYHNLEYVTNTMTWANDCVDGHLKEKSILSRSDLNVVCEFSKKPHRVQQDRSASVQVLNISFSEYGEGMARCQNGHITHVFLACGSQSVCGQGRMTPCNYSLTGYKNSSPGLADQRGTSVVLYACDGDDTTLFYTEVCDFRHDCQDKSDESFCRHPPCDAFACTNGQCVSYTKKCDKRSDCLDDSDETDCHRYKRFKKKLNRIPTPALINFDGISDFFVWKMKAGEHCPDTHYRCPGDVNNCLPVYTRCNEMYDCVGHEDEENCEDMMCPGFFRCRSSSVCVHADNLCDDWPHCPMYDDELFCGFTCPEVCLCHGHAFLCPQAFSAHLFPDLRYLDATGSGMSPSDISKNTYLVNLTLVQCSLTSLSDIRLSNLLFLDLSYNNLEHVDMSVFVGSDNLRVLSLANNPLILLHRDPARFEQQRSLRTLYLSHTTLTVLSSHVFSQFMSIRNLDLSFTTIHTIDNDGLQFMPHLTSLLMEGSPVNTFPPDLFHNLHRLRTISADNYKLCCRDILPDQFEGKLCNAPKDEISSCKDLLRTGTYRIFLWLISCMSVAGNAFCFIVRSCVLKASLTGFSVFVINLTMADFLMGIYTAVIGVVDEVYHGRYIYYDTLWKNSVACKLAGFLSLLSSEVSALIIWHITLDRFIVLHFPFSTLRFKRSSAAVAGLVSWIVGLLLASVPLLPVTSHWEFYSQTGLCIPLPITRKDFKGRVYSYSVTIVFNFVLFLLISVGQACIYWSVQKNTFTASTTKISQDMTIARRLITVAVTDFMCWFPIGMCGILALSGVSVPGEVNVAMAVFVLPLNSALNPFVYTFNTVVEKRRKSSEAKLLQWLESQADMMEK